MKKKSVLLSAIICICVIGLSSEVFAFATRDFFEIKIYHLKTAAQSQRVDQYLKNAYIPAMHRVGIKKNWSF